MADFQDPVTGNPITADQQTQAEKYWAACQLDLSQEIISEGPVQVCDRLYGWLDRQSRQVYAGGQLLVPLCRHARTSFLPDHALLTSAIACCLGYSDQNVSWLRLAALAHEFPDEVRQDLLRQLPIPPDWVATAWQDLDRQGAALLVEKLPLVEWQLEPPSTSGPRYILWLAHLVASNRLEVAGAASAFSSHPLAGEGQRVGLIFGGATKIKDYVFESAKLPDIRGASALLDRINLLDIPALWGRHPRWSRGDPVPETVARRFDEVQAKYTCLAAPECIIYANGGDLLALAPAEWAAQMAAQVEQLYARETLVAGAIAVAGTYSLLELQYGVACTASWLDEFRAAWLDQATRPSLEAYYGRPEPGQPYYPLFEKRKSFGELVSDLALKRYRRREGNPDAHGRAKPIPFFETLPHAQRCSSCDRRGAILQIPNLEDYLCEPCARKRWVGWLTKRTKIQEIDTFTKKLRWQPEGVDAWYRHYERWLADRKALRDSYFRDLTQKQQDEIDNPTDLQEIGSASRPRRFIGIIYGDGNNVGALIEKITSPGAYRQFAGRLYQATQDAVFGALARHLHPQARPGGELYHPFEILSIGGDDLFIIVPGDQALEIAGDVARSLEDAFRQAGEDSSPVPSQPAELQRYRPAAYDEAPPHVSLSAGVVIAAEDNPIYFLHDMVAELLKSAKKLAKGLKEETQAEVKSGRLPARFSGGTVDFAVLKSVTMVTSSVSNFRQEALQVHGKQSDLYLTARPYTLHELKGLLATVRKLKQVAFPRSQLYHLRSQLFKGRVVSTVDYLYFRSRLDKKAQEALWEAFDLAWHDVKYDLAPWRRRQRLPQQGKQPVAIWGDKFSKEPAAQAEGQAQRQPPAETILADLVEIYDFVSGEDADGAPTD